MRAVPASHGFGMTKAPVPSCSARKRVALSCWLSVIGVLSCSDGSPKRDSFGQARAASRTEPLAGGKRCCGCDPAATAGADDPAGPDRGHEPLLQADQVLALPAPRARDPRRLPR